MALKKNAHQMFTDREEPRQAFFETLRELEEDPGSSKIITYYGEGGIGKSWLLKDIRRRIEKKDYPVFSDGFEIRGEYVCAEYNLETSTDLVEILCQLRYILYAQKPDLSFPVFDCAVSRYKEITGKNVAAAEGNTSSSVLARYESLLDTASMFIPGLGTLQTLYGYVKKGGSVLTGVLNKIEDRKLRNEYSEYFEAVTTAETADDLRDNFAEFFLFDLNHQERDFGIIFMIDTFEILTYTTGLKDQSWLTDDLAKNAENTLWVFAGRNRIYGEERNEHLLGDLSEEDAKYYLREKAEIADEEIIERIYEISHGTPLFLDICVQNYRNEGYPSINEFRNFNKEQLVKRYVKYLSEGERLVIRLMSSMQHWTDSDYREVFNEVYNDSFTPYLESYNKVIRSTMIEKDNEERYFLHRAVRTGIYEDPDYPQEIKIAARDAMLSLYDRRVNENDCVYYASRYAELLQMIADEKQTLSDNQTLNLLYTLVNLVSLLHDRGRKNTAWFFDLTQSSTRSLTYTGTAVVYMLLFHAQCSLLMSDYETAYKSAGIAERALAKKFGIRNESTVFAGRIKGTAMINLGEYRKGAQVLEDCLNNYMAEYPENNPDVMIPTVGIRQTLMSVKIRLNEKDTDCRKAYEEDVSQYGMDHALTLLSANNYANSLGMAGKTAEAAAVLEEAYAHCDGVLGKSSDLTLGILSNLALYTHFSGNRKKAEEYILEVENRIEEGETEKGIEGTVFSLRGRFALDADDYETARKYLESAINVFNAPALKKTANAAEAYSLMGDLYRLTGKYGEAVNEYDTAEEIFRTVLGEDHPAFVAIPGLKGICLLSLGNPDEALRLCEYSWKKMKELCGEFDARTFDEAKRLENVYEAMNLQTQEAEQLYLSLERYYTNINQKQAKIYAKKAKEVRRHLDLLASDPELKSLYDTYDQTAKQYGRESEETLKAGIGIVKRLYDIREYRKSLDFAKEEYPHAKRILGEKDTVTVQYLYYIMLDQGKLMRCTECIESADAFLAVCSDDVLILEALKVKMNAQLTIDRTEEGLDTADRLYAMAESSPAYRDAALSGRKIAYHNLKHPEKKLEALRELYRLRSAEYGKNDNRTFNAAVEVLDTYRQMKKYESAYHFTLEAYTYIREHGSESEKANALVWIGSSAYYCGRYDEALNLLKQALSISEENDLKSYAESARRWIAVCEKEQRKS